MLDYIFTNQGFKSLLRDCRSRVGFAVQDCDGHILAARVVQVHGRLLPICELIGACAGLRFAIHELQANKILPQGDSITAVAWI